MASLSGRDAAEPALGAGCGDQNVRPGHVEAAEEDGGEDGDETLGDGVVAWDEGEAESDAEVVDKGDAKTAPAGEEAGLPDHMPHRGAGSACDGFVLDGDGLGVNEGLFLEGRVGVGRLLGVRVGCHRLSLRRLDHHEGCDDIANGVADLGDVVSNRPVIFRISEGQIPKLVGRQTG